MKISRDLDNHRSFGEIQPGKTELHDAGNVWGGAFWQVRQAIGKATGDALLLQAWKNLDFEKSRSDLTIFPLELLKQAARREGGKFTQQIGEIFRARGLKI